MCSKSEVQCVTYYLMTADLTHGCQSFEHQRLIHKIDMLVLVVKPRFPELRELVKNISEWNEKVISPIIESFFSDGLTRGKLITYFVFADILSEEVPNHSSHLSDLLFNCFDVYAGQLLKERGGLNAVLDSMCAVCEMSKNKSK